MQAAAGSACTVAVCPAFNGRTEARSCQAAQPIRQQCAKAGALVLQDRAEAKLATLEARAEDARREAAAREKQWRALQHERELVRCCSVPATSSYDRRGAIFDARVRTHVMCKVDLNIIRSRCTSCMSSASGARRR